MIPDKFNPTSIDRLLQIILNQYHSQASIFGIPKELYFVPSPADPFRFRRFGQLLENPIGVAAGPHTQLAQNIVAAWLCGARYIELKTIQPLDELEVSKPCIDMQDEGYNCEWSQELKIQQSFDQYLNAWIIIHILKHLFEGNFTDIGCIFNMSVGYNLEGIKNANVQWFLDKMQDASAELAEKIEQIKWIYPKILEIKINPCISNNITLSTMHGCPPDEIEKIGLYLLEEKQLHTIVKLNPTLLGRKQLLSIMQKSGYETIVPDIAFAHDLKYSEAINLINNIKKAADKQNLFFGIKLTNTLESLNNKDIFPEKEKMMYMSGSPLHPIAINLAAKLQNDFSGKLDISFSAGVDAFNIADVVSCGLYPATVCSDILKPGGYGRLNQYIENLKDSFNQTGSKSIVEFICKKSNLKDNNEKISALKNLGEYVKKLKNNKDYQKKTIKTSSIKTQKSLGIFDCIHAPCEYTCPTHQGIPDYMYYAASDDFENAKKIILQTNPFPHVTGMVCDQTCQSKCTRQNYDNPLLIRDIKRIVTWRSEFSVRSINRLIQNDKKVAIIGSGPSGIACAYFLSLAGFKVEIFESKDKPGGMVYAAIPKFRLYDLDIELDISQIQKLGVEIQFNQKIDNKRFESLVKNYDFVYIATGAPNVRAFAIEGGDSDSVINPLQFLYHAKDGIPTNIGKNVVVIGGGNTAIDTVRTAKRLTGTNGNVVLVYRRTIKQMPANEEEIKKLLEEKIEIMELVNPLKVNIAEGKVYSLTCQKMKLGEKDSSGRAKPLPIEGSEFEIACDTIIPAVGQETNIDFITSELLKTRENDYETQIPNVFVGGDALNGGVSIVAAIADGRKVAQIIIDRLGIELNTKTKSNRPKTDYKGLMLKKLKRIKSIQINELSGEKKKYSDSIPDALTKEEAIVEASRCLLCDELCNICTTVCPNLALFAYQVEPFSLQHGEINFKIEQATQILHIADWCNQCGNCNTFCPTSGAPYEKKPHLYLDKKVFEQAQEGFYFDLVDEKETLTYKNSDEIHMLTENPTNYSYLAPKFSAQIAKQTFKIQNISDNYQDEQIDLTKAIEMSVILNGVKQFLSNK